MKKQLVLLALSIITSSSFAQNFQWAKSFGSNGYDDGTSITLDASGNIYAIGVFSNTVDFDPSISTSTLTSNGSNDIYITKFDALGNFIWVRSFGSTGAEFSTNVKTDATGNVYVAGSFQGTVDFDPGVGTVTLTSASTSGFIAKFATNGNFVFVKDMSVLTVDEITLDGSGNIISTGFFQGTPDFDPSASTYTLTTAASEDVYISKLDASGNFIWAKTFGGNGSDRATSIGVDASGNIIIAGYYILTADFDPSASTSTITAVGSYDAFVSKFDGAGNFIWAKSVGGAGWDQINAVSADVSGNVISSGYFNSTVDFDPGVGTTTLVATGGNNIFVLKLDASGVYSWAKRMGGSSNSEVDAMAIDASSNIYTTGLYAGNCDFDPSATTYSLSSAGAYDLFVSKLDGSGNFVWAKTIGGPGNDDRGLGIVADLSGNVYTVGHFQLTADFDPSTAAYTLTSAGNADVFISKLTPCPSPAGAITGSLSICQGANNNFSVAAVSGATGYNWTIPFGSSISTGVNTNSITLLTGANSGSIIVTPTNSCGNGASSTIAVTVLSAPIITTSVAPSSTICAGNSITLTGTGASTYTWTNGNSNGVAFVPSASAIYTVTGTGANGCNASVTLSITINSLPTVIANATNSNICIGGTITLNGGGANTYTWTNGVTNGITFSPTTSLTYTVTGTNTLTGCKNTATKLITVNNLPTVTANTTNSVICIGNSVTLTGSGANTYTWTNGVTDGVAITPTNSATYIVTGTDLNNCLNSSSITITVNQLPVLNTTATNSIVCSGQQVTLGANGAATYTWIPGNQSGFLVNVTPTVTTIYTVTGTGSNSCNNIMTQSISVNTLPAITASTTNTLLCIGQTATLSATGANSYTWSTSENGVSIVVNPTSNTIYTISGTDNNGCNGTTTFTQNVSLCTGLDAISVNSNLLINIYPNPNNGDFIIKTDTDMNLNLINSLGQVIQVLSLNENNNHQLSIEGLSSGIYFMTSKNNHGSFNHKVIVTK